MPEWMLIVLLVVVVLFVVVSLIAMFIVMGTKRRTGTMRGGRRSSGKGHKGNRAGKATQGRR